MKSVKLGIIGCGKVSKSHIQLARQCSQAEVTAVADVNKDRAKAVAEEFGISKYYFSGGDLLNDDNVDAVILALPTGVRTPIAYKTLEHKKHLLLEKPVASKAYEVEKMIQMRGNLTAGCCSSRLTFTGHAQAAQKVVQSGALGQIREVKARAVKETAAEPNPNPPAWRESIEQNGGGFLVNWGCYDLNYLMEITEWQLKPKTVLAKWWPVADKMSDYVAKSSDADAHYNAFIICENQIVLSMERAEFSSSKTDQAWEIIGTEATLHMPMQHQEGKPDAVVLDKFVPGKGIVSENIWEKPEQDEQYGNIVSDFVEAIINGTEPKTNLERALVMQKITDAVYSSSTTDASVKISS
jgi:predicted dehydrogenase